MTDTPLPDTEVAGEKGRWRRFLDSDFFYSFQRSPVAVVSFAVVCILVLSAIFAPLIAPTNPFDPASLNLMEFLRESRWRPKAFPTFVERAGTVAWGDLAAVERVCQEVYGTSLDEMDAAFRAWWGKK